MASGTQTVSTYAPESQPEYSIRPLMFDSLKARQKNLVERLENFEAPWLKEKLFNDGVMESQEEYDLTFSELKKFFLLGALHRKPTCMASEKVDEVWHQLILFTKEYHAFCDDMFGHYLHHTPKTSYTMEGMEEAGENVIDLYRTTFGEPPEIWSFSSESSAQCCCSKCSDD